MKGLERGIRLILCEEGTADCEHCADNEDCEAVNNTNSILALIASEQAPLVEALEESQAMLKEYKGRIQFIKDMDKAVAHDNILERLSEAESKIDAALKGEGK